MKTKWQKVGLLILMGVVIVLRLPSCFTPIWNMDEAVSACVANAIVDGGVPYKDAIDHRGPVTYYAYALVFWLGGKNAMIAVHVMLCFVVLGVMLLIFACGALSATPRAGWLAALMFVLLSSGLFEVSDLFAAHTEFFLILFTTLAAYLLLRSHYRRTPLLMFGSGLAYGLAVLAKQPALLDCAAAGGFLLCLALFHRRSLWAMLTDIALLISGVLVIVAAVIFYFYWRGALADFVFYGWTYNTDVYLPEITLLNRVNSLFVPLNYLIKRFFPIAVVFFAGMIFLPIRFFTPTTTEATDLDAGLLFVGWSISSLAGAAASGRAFGHYYLQLLPALCLVAGITTDAALRLGRTYLISASKRPVTVSQRILWPALILSSLTPLVLPVAVRVAQSVRNEAADKSGQRVVQYIRQTTPEQATMFVWGFYPELYVLAERTPASRYTFTNVLTGMIPWTNTAPDRDTTYAIVPGAWDILMRELAAAWPQVVIDTSPGDHRCYGKYPIEAFPVLHHWLQRHYTLAYEVLTDSGEVSFRVLLRKAESAMRGGGCKTDLLVK